MSEELYRLRYVPGTKYGDMFSSIRYPWHVGVPLDRIKKMHEAMPTPEHFEVVPDGQ